MLGLVDIPSVLVFWTLPVLASVVLAVWTGGRGGILTASTLAAVSAAALYAIFLLFTVGYSPTGISIAASITLVQYGLLCVAMISGLSWLQRKARERR